MRRARAVLLVIAVLAAATLGGCGADDSPKRTGPAGSEAGSWQRLPAPPLAPRETALTLWDGREVLVIGGSDARPCPPNAGCTVPEEPPLADGAAFDPRTRTWRRIADAPVPFDWAQPALVGRTAYLLIPGTPGRPRAERAFLAFHVDENRWERLPEPGGPRDDYALVGAGGRLVAYPGSDENGERADLVYDPHAREWTELPADPLSPSFGRWMAWSGRELVLFAHELVPNPGAEGPTLTRAAALELGTGTWRRLPDSELLGTGPWFRDGDRLVNPTLGGADGGETGNWGRTYPYGGILDPEHGEWSALPAPPQGEDVFGAGILAERGAHYIGHGGWLLDTRAGAWLEIPRLDGDALVTGRSVAAAGRDLFVFGGARWGSDSDARLLDEAWTWSPPGAAAPQ